MIDASVSSVLGITELRPSVKGDATDGVVKTVGRHFPSGRIGHRQASVVIDSLCQGDGVFVRVRFVTLTPQPIVFTVCVRAVRVVRVKGKKVLGLPSAVGNWVTTVG